MNQKLRIGVIGARKNISGIGEYFVKFFEECGAKIECIMGSTEESARETSNYLNKKYNVNTRHYSNITQMLENEYLDIVAICSPSRTHYQYLMQCLNAGVSVLCEKPFIWGEKLDLIRETESIINLAKKKNLQLGMNCQWTFTLDCYQNLCGRIIPENIDEFYMYMSPPVKGEEMIPDSLPHIISMLCFVLGDGRTENISFKLSKDQSYLNMSFNYLSKFGCCSTGIELKQADIQPRRFGYGFNGKIVDRMIDITDYEISFKYNDNKIQIEDPLKSSLSNFLSSFINRTSPRIDSEQILINMEQLVNIQSALLDYKKSNWRE